MTQVVIVPVKRVNAWIKILRSDQAKTDMHHIIDYIIGELERSLL